MPYTDGHHMRLVIESGLGPGRDLVMSAKKRLPRFADFEEYRSDGGPSHRMRASASGVRIESHPTRILGHDQARMMGETIIKAADEAAKRGAPSHIMGG